MFYSDKKYFNSLLKKKKMNIAITEHIQFLSKRRHVDSSKKNKKKFENNLLTRKTFVMLYFPP